MTTPSRSLRTKDLSKAAYLALQGFDYTLEREGVSGRDAHPVGRWVFTATNGGLPTGSALEDANVRFDRGDCLVEPVAYQQELTRVRRELYDFLAIPRRGDVKK